MSAELFQLASGSAEIGPYLHPDHWDGHTLGQGDIDRLGVPFGITPSAGKLATATLTSYLRDPGERQTFQTYEAGDIFYPGEYQTGTIVAYKRERLIGLAVGLDLSDIVAAPIDPEIQPGKHFSDYVLTAPVEGQPDVPVFYQSSSIWGVVTRPEGVPTVVSVLPRDVTGVPPDVVVKSASHEHEKRMPIGTVHHTEALDVEVITRINRLQVCTSGPYIPSDLERS